METIQHMKRFRMPLLAEQRWLPEFLRQGIHDFRSAYHYQDRHEVPSIGENGTVRESLKTSDGGTAQKLLTQEAWNGKSLQWFDTVDRNPLHHLKMPFEVLLYTPFLLRQAYLVWCFTYLVPVFPLMVWWDEWSDNLRTYSPEELEAILSHIHVPGYQFEVSAQRQKNGSVQYRVYGYKDLNQQAA